MELRQLEYFRTVCQFNNITKAANSLHVSQPSITVAIQKLEEELGVKLFDRSQKQLALTPEGSTFLQRVSAILDRVQDVEREMHDYRILQKGSIKIGIPPMIGAFLFPYIFAKFQQAYPYLKIIATEEGSLSIRSRLERGELDVGIIIASPSPRLNTVPIVSGEILACLPPRHPLGMLPSIPFGEFRDQPLILFKEDTYSRQLILKECQAHQFTPNIVFSSGQIETTLGLVGQGVGITFLLDVIARKHPEILARPLANPLHVQIGLAWNRERYLSIAAKTFIDFITASDSAS